MPDKLKACPFSGETPQTEYWSPSDGRHRDYSSGAWVVTIKSRFACVEKSSLLSRDDAESKAIEAWNTRAKASQGGEAVAMVVSRSGNDLRIGWLRPELCEVGSQLYTRPAGQVDGVVVSRELLERALKADASIGANAIQLADGWNAMAELRALLAKSEGVKK